MDKITECIDAEYLLENSPDFLRTIYGDVRIKRAGFKTGCRIEVTRRILRRLVSPGNWTRLSILRVTGPDEKSIAQFNRLIEACIPLHSHRKEYPRRNVPTISSKPANQLEMGSSKSTPKARTRLTSMKRSVCTPLPANTPINDLGQSENTLSDNNRPGAPQKIVPHIPLRGTRKPKPRAQSKILPESALLSSPMKDMITCRKQIPSMHNSQWGGVVIIGQPLEKQTPRETFATPLTADRPASGAGISGLSNPRNTTAIGNTKRLHLSKSKINEVGAGQDGEFSSNSAQKPRRPRSLVMKSRLQSSSAILSNVKRELSHHSKKETREVSHFLSPLVSAGSRTERKKSNRMRKSPISDASSPERSTTKRIPSISPSKLCDKARQKGVNIVLIAVENEEHELTNSSYSSIPKAEPTTSGVVVETKPQANRSFESSFYKLPREALGIFTEMVEDKQKIPSKVMQDPSPKIETPKLHTHIPITETEALGSLPIVTNEIIDSFAEEVVDRLVAEHVERATDSEADAFLMEQTVVNTTSMVNTAAPILTPGPIKIRDNVDLINEVSRPELAKSRFGEPANIISRPQSISHSPIIDQATEGLVSDRVCDITEGEFSTSRANSCESTESTKRAQLTHSQLSFVDHVPIGMPLGILKALEIPVYDENTDVGLDTNHRIHHLIEHVVSVLSEETMPSPMSTYMVNPAKSHAETRHDSKNACSFSMSLPSQIRGYSDRLDRILYVNSSERQTLVGDENASQFKYEFGKKFENRGELPPSPPPAQESDNQDQHYVDIDAPGFSSPTSKCEPVKMNLEESPKVRENQRLELQGGDYVKETRCTAIRCEVNKEESNRVFVKTHQFEENALLTTSLIEVKSPMQVTTNATIEGREKEVASSEPDSLPTSTSSIPLELPGASHVTECGGQQILQRLKAERLIKSADGSPPCFGLTNNISKSAGVRANNGNKSYRKFLQNCNASTTISVDLEDQENTHNANTGFSNKGKMESPVSFTPITDLQGEGCGTSTMESFYRVVGPAFSLVEVSRGYPNDMLADSTFNVSETSNENTYASSLKSESFY
ncbi:hypothetical protein Aperf_G00000036632 [Anoplocephala perfoliata]